MAIDQKRGVDRLMVDLPLAAAAHIKRIAKEQKRSVNFILCEMLITALHDAQPRGLVEEEQAPYGEIASVKKKPKKEA
jgi:hypothetical protein